MRKIRFSTRKNSIFFLQVSNFLCIKNKFLHIYIFFIGEGKKVICPTSVLSRMGCRSRGGKGGPPAPIGLEDDPEEVVSPLRQLESCVERESSTRSLSPPPRRSPRWSCWNFIPMFFVPTFSFLFYLFYFFLNFLISCSRVCMSLSEVLKRIV